MTQQTYIMLQADEGKILTNGETYGRVVALGSGDVPENWREVDEAEYTAYLEAEEAKAAAAAEMPQESENNALATDKPQWAQPSQNTTGCTPEGGFYGNLNGKHQQSDSRL